MMNNAIPILDLFAGAGGFGLGFKNAGFRPVGFLEYDGWACETLKENNPHVPVIKGDISNFSAEDILRETKVSPEVMIGGPPCQGYSLCRRGRGEPADPRNRLVFEYLRLVEEFQPKLFIIENVANIAKAKNVKGDLVRDVLREEIEALDYNFYLQVLKASDFGVPQIRQRCFIIGSKHSVANPFPKPTTAITPNTDDLFENITPCPNLWDAISDLPELRASEGGEITEYTSDPNTEYQVTMRRNSSLLFNHKAMNHTKRMVARFESMACGQNVSHVADHLKPRRRNSLEVSKKVYDQNNRRQHADRPCHTIAASFYANFVHPFQHRNFTAREGARIQSFPDHYRFMGKPTVVSRKLLQREGRSDELFLCQYNQIGNAVPPMLAEAIANNILEEYNVSSWEQFNYKAIA